MPPITWDAPGARTYEAGVDRGVLYVRGYDAVPWNGLVSVNEKPNGGKLSGSYMDGVRYLTSVEPEEYKATINAVTYPDEFSHCDGVMELGNGLLVTGQARTPFDLSYRTGLGDDLDGLKRGYKIHLVYNAIAAATDRDYGTLSTEAGLNPFSWDIETVPGRFGSTGWSAHFVVDSTKTAPELLAILEDILYGRTEAARMPSVTELGYVFGWNLPEYSGQPATFLGSFRDISKTTRRNYHRYPQASATSPLGWVRYGVGTSITRDDIILPGRYATKLGWASNTDAAPYVQVANYGQGANDAVAPSGQAGLHIATAMVRAATGLQFTFQLAERDLTNGAPNYAITPRGTPVTYTGTNNWNRISVTGEPSKVTSAMVLTVSAPVGQVGDLYLDRYTNEPYETAGEFFFGSASYDPLFERQAVTPRWDGAVYLSTSSYDYYEVLSNLTSSPGGFYLLNGRIFMYNGGYWVDRGPAI